MHTQVAFVVAQPVGIDLHDTLRSAEAQCLPTIIPRHAYKLPTSQVVSAVGDDAPAINDALSEADADWIVVLRDGDLLPPDFLFHMWHGSLWRPADKENGMFFRRAPVQRITGDLSRVELTVCAPNVVRALQHPLNRNMPVENSFMFPKNAWRMVHGFDPQRTPLHFLDFALRLVRIGLVCKQTVATCMLKSAPKIQVNESVLQSFNAHHRLNLTPDLI